VLDLEYLTCHVGRRSATGNQLFDRVQLTKLLVQLLDERR
jgi:hypothetical protein